MQRSDWLSSKTASAQPHIASYYVFADMVALPDFAFSGMENWGIIMYREAALLYKPNASSEANKQRTAGILSHELAHQVCFFNHDLLSRRSLTVLLLLQKILLTHGKPNVYQKCVQKGGKPGVSMVLPLLQLF